MVSAAPMILGVVSQGDLGPIYWRSIFGGTQTRGGGTHAFSQCSVACQAPSYPSTLMQ